MAAGLLTPFWKAAALCLHLEAGFEALEHCCHGQHFQVFAQRCLGFRRWIKPINSNKIYSVGITFLLQSQLPTELPHKRGLLLLELANKAPPSLCQAPQMDDFCFIFRIPLWRAGIKAGWIFSSDTRLHRHPPTFLL